jgi:hypothetical protein
MSIAIIVLFGLIAGCGTENTLEIADINTTTGNALTDTKTNYLIVTAPKFAPLLAGFVQFRGMTGFNVRVLSTATTGKLKTQIRDAIQVLYNDPTTQPVYVLLVGDADEIPVWSRNELFAADKLANRTGWTTDLGYALLEGNDILPDVFLGRFPAATATDLHNMINKTMRQELFNSKNNKEVLFLSGAAKRAIAQTTHEGIMTDSLLPNGYVGTDFFTTTNYKAQAIAKMNQGPAFIQYDGHGVTGGWTDALSIGVYDVRALTNTFYPVVIAGACETAFYAMPEAVGETWLRTASGASAYIGATDRTSDGQAIMMEEGLFDALVVQHITRIGPALNQMKNQAYPVIGYDASSNLFSQYNLLGDPALQVIWP